MEPFLSAPAVTNLLLNIPDKVVYFGRTLIFKFISTVIVPECSPLILCVLLPTSRIILLHILPLHLLTDHHEVVRARQKKLKDAD